MTDPEETPEWKPPVNWPRVLLIFAMLLAIGFLMSCCSPEAKLRRAKRLINQAENAGLDWKSDTVFHEIKVVVPETHFDTVLKRVNFRDTLIVTKDKVVTRVKVNTMEKEIFIETKCPEKVVIKKVPYTVTREIEVGFSKMGLIWRIAAFSLLTLIVGFVIGRFTNISV